MNRQIKRLLLMAAITGVGLILSCGNEASKEMYGPCETNDDCTNGQVCEQNHCVNPDGGSDNDSDTGLIVGDDNGVSPDEDVQTYPDSDRPMVGDKDSDGDGIPDSVEGTDDLDNDGKPNYLDDDSDGDGISDKQETPNHVLVDTDSDGTPDYLDLDSDGDTIPDAVEGIDDVDGDGALNYRDEDSDGDYIPDVLEVGNADPEHPVDSDGDGTPDYLDTDSDDDTVEDAFEGIKDVDGDGKPNFLDLDSDGDGISDKDERGTGSEPLDSDHDSKFDFVDLDSDNDGLADKLEIFCTNLGKDARLFADTDGDGFSDMAEDAVGSDMCDPNQGVTDMPGIKFYFELPYNKPEKTDVLNFAPTVKMADIWFNVDTTGSMGGEIETLKSSLTNTIIPGIRARVTDSAFGVAYFSDTDGGGTPPGYGIIQTPTTDTAVAQSKVNVLHQSYGGYGGDCAELGWPSLTNIANSTGWRERAIPIVMHITDANSKGDRASTVAALNAKGIKVISVMSSGGCGGPSGELTAIASETGAVVPQCADAGRTVLKYDINADGSGLDTAVINGVDALVKYAVFDVYAEVTDDGDSSTPDTSKFLKKVEALEYVAPPNEPEHSCAPTATPATFNSSAYNNGFKNFSTGTASPSRPGSTLRFTVIAKNDFYEPEERAQAFKAHINIVDAKTKSILDVQDVTIIVPPKTIGQDN